MHWAEFFASNFAAEGTQRIAAGITPSGEFHIGHLREILTCDIIFRAVRNTGGQSFEDLAQMEREEDENLTEYVEDDYWLRRINQKTGDLFKSRQEFDDYLEAGGRSLIEHEPGAVEAIDAWTRDVVDARVENEDFTEFIFIVDDADPLRKVYPFLHEEYEEFVGHQLGNIPPPDLEGKPDYARYEGGKGDSYADHFVKPFIEALKKIGVHPIIIHNLELYESGEYSEYIDAAFQKAEEIREIITNVSGRELPEDWCPFNPVGSDGSMEGVKVTGYDSSKGLVSWIDRHGTNGTSDISKGEGKLPWRIEWAAKWALLRVSCEPFGKDHGASGGSYDTGKEIVKLFTDSQGNPCEAPLPLTYEWISIKGGGAMSSSTGKSIGPLEVLEIVPPEIVRFLIAKNQPKRHIDFDTGSCLIELSDEYQKALETLEKYTTQYEYDGDSVTGVKSEAEDIEKLSKRQKKALQVLISTFAYSQIEDITEGAYADDSWIDEMLAIAGGVTVSFRHLSLLAQLYPDDRDVWQSLFDSNLFSEYSPTYKLLMELGDQNIGSPYIEKAGFVLSSDDFNFEEFLSEHPDNETELDKLRSWDSSRELAAWEIYSSRMIDEEGWSKGHTHTLPRRLQTIRNWITSEHFPEGYRLRIQTQLSENAKEHMEGKDVDYLQALKKELKECDWESTSINDNVCNLAKEHNMKLNETYQLLYWIVLDQHYGPKLKSILSQMDRHDVLDLLQLAIDELSA